MGWKLFDERTDASLFPLFLTTESATLAMKECLGISYTALMISFHGKKWAYYEKEGEGEKISEFLSKRIEEDTNYAENAIKKTYEKANALLEFTQGIYTQDLSKDSNEKLWEYYAEYCRLNKEMRGYAWIAPALDQSQGFSAKLEQIVRKHTMVESSKVYEYVVALTQPVKQTRLKQQEIALLKLACEVEKNEDLRNLFAQSVKQIQQKIISFP